MHRTEPQAPLLDAAPGGILLEAGEARYSVGDALRLADLRGALGRVLERFLEAETRRRAAELSADRVTATVTEWRYARSLTAADETEAWLAARGLGVSDLVRHAERRLAAAAVAEAGSVEPPSPDAGADQPPASPEEVPAELYGELVLSGQLEDWAWELAVCAAGWEIWCRFGPGSLGAEDLAGAVEVARASLSAPLLPGAAARDRLLEREALHRLRARVVADSERLRRILANERLSFLSIDAVYADLPTEAAARELRLLVEEDDETFAAAAACAGSSVRALSGTLASFVPELRGLLLSAPPGGTVGPIASDGVAGRVYHLLAKREPSLEDAAVRRAVEARVLQEWERAEVARCIRWVAWTPAGR